MLLLRNVKTILSLGQNKLGKHFQMMSNIVPVWSFFCEKVRNKKKQLVCNKVGTGFSRTTVWTGSADSSA